MYRSSWPKRRSVSHWNIFQGTVIAYIVIVLLMIIGWGMNIYKVVTHFDMAHITGEIIVRIAGIPLFPVGGIYGWF